MPNSSLKRSANGRPPGPVWWYAYIFTSPGLASCRRSRLTSNVRPHQNHAAAVARFVTQRRDDYAAQSAHYC